LHGGPWNFLFLTHLPLVYTKHLNSFEINAMWTLATEGGAAGQNPAALAELAAGEEVGEARELTKDRFVAGVGAERPPAGVTPDFTKKTKCYLYVCQDLVSYI
jgi:hypothetical protein